MTKEEADQIAELFKCHECTPTFRISDDLEKMNFRPCEKHQGIAEEMLKDFEKQTKNKISEKERAYNLKSFEKMLEKQNERMFNFIESEDEEIL